MATTLSPKPRGPAPAHEIGAALHELLDLAGGERWIVSCYQKLEPGDRAGEKYRIKLKNRLRRAAERLDVLGLSHAERESVRHDLARIEEFFRNPSNLMGGRGVALFAWDGLFRVVRLPYVLRSRVLVDRTPVVGELVALAEDSTRLLVVVADRRAARFFDVGLSGVVELEGLAAPDATRAGKYHPNKGTVAGLGEYHFHTRIREERQRHLARIAEAVTAKLRSGPFEGVVVGGIGAEADALPPHLHPTVRDRVVGVLKLAPKKVTAAEIRERAVELLAGRAAERAEQSVEEFLAALPTGWAINGVEPTLRALARGQVRTLLVDHEATVPGFRCSGSGRLTESAAGCRDEGEPVPSADVLDDAIEDALRQRAHVAVLRGAPARRFDRLGAILRFRLGK